MKTKTPRETDVRIGQNIRAARLAIHFSQEKLADCVGVTFQQIQKYEKGSNRVGGSRMEAIAKALGVSISSLFGDDNAPCIPVMSTEAIKVARAFEAISSPTARLAVMAFVRTMARETEGDGAGQVERSGDDYQMSSAH